MTDSPNPSAARIEAMAKAEYEHWDFSEEVPWEEADDANREWHRESAVAMLAAADSVERPAVERLVAALRELLEVWRDPQVKADRAHLAEMDADEVLAEFGQQPTGDEQ